MLVTVSMVVPVDPCPMLMLACEEERVKSPGRGVGFELNEFTSWGSAMNAPITDPSTRTPTRSRDQTGTVLLTADAVDSIWLIDSIRVKGNEKASLLPPRPENSYGMAGLLRRCELDHTSAPPD